MKHLILILAIFSSYIVIAQDNEVDESRILFNINLRNHDTAQLFHLQMSDDYKYAIMGVIKGKKPFLNRRYRIDSIEFYVDNFEGTKEKLYIEHVCFEGFENDTTKLKVELTKATKGKYYLKKRFLIFKNSLLDIELHPKDYTEGRAFYTRKGLEYDDRNKNIGGHICRSIVVH